MEMLDPIFMLLERGGWSVGIILLVGVALWALILERYWYLTFQYPHDLTREQAAWLNSQSNTMPQTAREITANSATLRYRQGVIQKLFRHRLGSALHRNIMLIKTLISLCPLLGLTGTVLGMIDIFDVLSIIGNGDARALADGVSQATLPTLTGMVVALSGIYFSADIHKRAALKTVQLVDTLGHPNHHSTSTSTSKN